MEKIGNNINSYLKWALTLVFIFGAAIAHADVTVTATVDHNQINIDDTLTYTITVSSSDTVEVEPPTLPTFDGFALLNQSSGMEAHAQWVQNAQGQQEFKTLRSQVFNYTLQPQRVGPITIGVAEVVVGGKSYRTQIIRIEVTKNSAAGSHTQQQAPSGSGNQSDEDLFSQLLQRRGLPFQGQQLNPNEAFHVVVQVDKTKAYVGEQVTASWYLLTTGLIRDLDTLKYPDLRDFWKEDIEIATQLNFTQQVINGVAYKKALLASSALFPLKAGTAIIDPYKAKATVIAGGGAFGAFGFGQPYQFTKASQEVKIQVLPLPVEGRPKDFSGAVGEFSIKGSVGKTTIPANQPVEFKLRIEGKGNAKMIELPALNLPQSLELYDKKDESKFFPNGTSYKEFTIYLIPREAGTVTIPSIRLGVFNPKTARYEEKSTAPITLKVLPGANSNVGSGNLGLAQSPKPQKPTMPDITLQWEAKSPMPLKKVAAIWSAIFLAIFLGLFWRGYRELGIGQKKRDLAAEVKRRFRKIMALADQQNWREVGKETTNTVYFLLGEISGQGGANMQLDKLWLHSPPSVRRELEASVTKLMSSFEVLSFAPDELAGELKQRDKLRTLVAQMEKLMARAVALSSKMETGKPSAENQTTI